MSYEQRSTILPISSEAEALRQAVLLTMKPNRRETTQQNENQEGMTTIVQPQQTETTQEESLQNDRYTTPPPRRSLRTEERFNTPEAQILDTQAVLKRQSPFSPEEGEYVNSSGRNSEEGDPQRFIPITNPFNVMQASANGTNFERTAGNLLQRYMEESPEMTFVFNGTVVRHPPMEVNFDDDESDAEDNDVRNYIGRCCRVSTPCPRNEDLTPSNYILDYVETLEASQNNGNEDMMQIDSEEQVNENGGTELNNYIVSDRKGDVPIPSTTTIFNNSAHGPGTVDEEVSFSSNNNCASEISSEVSAMRVDINHMNEVPSNAPLTFGECFNKTGGDPPNSTNTNGDIQISNNVNQINDDFINSTSIGDDQMVDDINQIRTHTISDVQNADDFSQMNDNFSPVLAHPTVASPVYDGNDDRLLPDDIVITNERSSRMNDIPAHNVGSPAEEGEIEEGEIVESEITFEEHGVQVKNTDEETRELMKELYEEYGAKPFDIIQEGIPIDVVVRFTRELNRKLPPELEVFSVITPNDQVSLSTQVNSVLPSVEPVIKLEPVEDNLPITNNKNDQRESSLAPTSFQVRPSFDRPFMTPREQNFIIDLSDSSDGEHRITGLLQEVKSSLSNNETQIDAKRKLEEKEREIKRMNELIASKTELLKKKSTTAQQASASTSSNVGTSIDTIRAAIESFETAKSQVSEVKSRLNEEEKRLENIRSELADTDIKIGKNSSLIEQNVEQIKSFGVQKDQILQKKEEIELRIRALQDDLVKVQSQIEDIDNEKEVARIELAKKKEEYTEQLRKREQQMEQEKRVSENITQIKKQLGSMLKDIKAKKEQLSQMVFQSTKARNESTVAESSTSVFNKNGKRRVVPESEIIQEETPKKPKLALEVAELSKKIEQVSKEQQSLRESLEKKRQGDTETTITRKSQNSYPENEWRVEKIASQETISEDKFEICAFELQPRGICNDDDCRSQHFRDLPMTENEVIDDLTGYYEGENLTQQRHYREGLHKLLNDLEMSGRSTFLAKFEEIKKYRDTFVARSLNDGTGAPRIVFINERRPLVDEWYTSPPACESESDYVSESLPTPRMPTSLSSGQDDDQQQIYPTSPELEDEDDDGDYFSSSATRHKKKDDEENVKYESYGEEMEMGNESDDQFAELRESESAYSESVTSSEKDDDESEEENVGEKVAVDVGATEFISTNHGEVEEQQQRHEQQGERAYAPLGYVGRIFNWFSKS
ncbi:hypothetical protein GLOIN_2v1565205 [Rhizophagus clarus]|uniref:Putative zinc-finger domain-containing protein n=1 Tax=Rhizophagus clarus TaxID=94130 RepID=A0A8H3L1A4_9GLOM|nr:hypothetical protein GLOIN_2v1565205 [Rhizophagus clarus]